MTLSERQRKAMFAKLRKNQFKQFVLLRDTTQANVKKPSFTFSRKENVILLKSDKISNNIIRKGNAKDVLLATKINTDTQKMFLRKARISGVPVKRLEAARKKGGF